MNIISGFRIFGDTLHLISHFQLLIGILMARSTEGISLQTQYTLLSVYSIRLKDVFENKISSYETGLQLTCMSFTWVTVTVLGYLYNQKDLLKIRECLLRYAAILIGCIPFAFFANYFNCEADWGLPVVWAYSVCLEAIAMVPQYYMVIKEKRVNPIAAIYISLYITYRWVNLSNWVNHSQKDQWEYVVYLCGASVEQIFALLFVIWFTYVFNQKKMEDDSARAVKQSRMYIIHKAVRISDKHLRKPTEEEKKFFKAHLKMDKEILKKYKLLNKDVELTGVVVK